MKKLLLGLGSIASVVAPVAAVISCGDDSKTNTDAHVSTPVALDQATAGTVNTNFESFGMQAADIAKTEKSSSFTFGASHPVTYDKVVIFTLAAKAGGYSMTIGGETVSSTMAVEAGDKVVFAAKTTTRRAAASVPTVAAFFVPKDTDKPTVDLSIGDAAQEAVAKKILMPVFPELAQGAGSDNTGGTDAGATPTHKTVDFTGPATGHATSQKWHETLTEVDAHGNRSFHLNLVAGDTITATVNGQLHSHTLTTGEISTLAAIHVQDDAVNKIAELIAQDTANGAVSPDDVKAAFKLDTPGPQHSFTATVSGGSGSVGTPSTADIRIDLGASTSTPFAGGEITWTNLWTKIDTAIGTNHPAHIVLTVDAKDLTIALTVWTQQGIKDALNAALTNASGFAGCFDTSK